VLLEKASIGEERLGNKPEFKIEKVKPITEPR
jgi:hypothetical protein